MTDQHTVHNDVQIIHNRESMNGHFGGFLQVLFSLNSEDLFFFVENLLVSADGSYESSQSHACDDDIVIHYCAKQFDSEKTYWMNSFSRGWRKYSTEVAVTLFSSMRYVEFLRDAFSNIHLLKRVSVVYNHNRTNGV